MAFNMICVSKGCGELQEPYLDPDTNKVYCSVCNNEIVNITIFAINQMKMNKQYRKKSKTPFSVVCSSCKAQEQPIVEDGELLCAACFKTLDNLSPHFKIMYKNMVGAK